MMDNWTKYNVCKYAEFFLKLKQESIGDHQCMILKRKKYRSVKYQWIFLRGKKK